MDQQLRDSIEQYRSLDWTSLLRKDLGSYSLEESKPSFEGIREVFDTIFNHADLENFPPQFLNSIRTHLQQFLQLKNQILGFQNINERQQWLDTIRNKEFELHQSMGPFYTFLVLKDPAKNEEFKRQIIDAQGKIGEFEAQITKAQSLLSTVQNEAQKIEAIKYGRFFGDCADKNDQAAKNAQTYMALSAGVTLIIAILLLAGDTDWFVRVQNQNTSQVLTEIFHQGLLLKFLILSIGGFAIAHFNRNYSAEKHLYYVNTQRQNALDSHQALLNSIRPTESENDKETANAMLAELTRAIFDTKDTGYLKTISNPGNPVRQVIELTKSDK